MAAPSDEGADDGEQWKYELEDLEDDTDDADEVDSPGGPEDDRRPDRSIEPGEIDPENAAFVVLGAVVAVIVLVRTVAIFAP